MPLEDRYWEKKPLSDMNEEEWEALCDGCARCCLHKAVDEEQKKIYYTNIACQYLDIDKCRCKVYEKRHELVPACADLHKEAEETLKWMPASCAYRRLSEGAALPHWHPLISGDNNAVEKEGLSIKNYAIPEDTAGEIEEHIVSESDY